MTEIIVLVQMIRLYQTQNMLMKYSFDTDLKSQITKP